MVGLFIVQKFSESQNDIKAKRYLRGEKEKIMSPFFEVTIFCEFLIYMYFF